MLGIKKMVTLNKLNEYVPTIEITCKNCKWSIHENTIRFHGNPPKMKLLINSNDEKKIEKINIEENFLLKEKKEQANVEIP